MLSLHNLTFCISRPILWPSKRSGGLEPDIHLDFTAGGKGRHGTILLGVWRCAGARVSGHMVRVQLEGMNPHQDPTGLGIEVLRLVCTKVLALPVPFFSSSSTQPNCNFLQAGVWWKDWSLEHRVRAKELFCDRSRNLKGIDKIYVWRKHEKQRDLSFLPIVAVDRKIKLHLEWEMKIYSLHPEKKRCKLQSWAFRESEEIAVTLRDTDLYPTCLEVTSWFENKNAGKYH